ncbi:hypothetical protein VNI00_009262 [Paramarasmius palmivorus]|uniref:Glutathione S-transferase UstS-like C-terminal domain-containing protein n=1 Tax=Paramarasmius palmivorus TaxID=297713 RepID=A0AAW0CSP7_9AGAR
MSFLGYEDIEPTAKSIGAPPTGTRPDGVTARYTVPIIYDSDKDVAISDSILIAEYLDAEYPNTPSVLPSNTRSLHAAFADVIFGKFRPIIPVLGPKSRSFMSQQLVDGQKKAYGEAAVSWALTPEQEAAAWKETRLNFYQMEAWYAEGKLYIMGDELSHGDFTIAAMLWWIKEFAGSDTTEWAEASSWAGGRAGKLMDVIEGLDNMQVLS